MRHGAAVGMLECGGKEDCRFLTELKKVAMHECDHCPSYLTDCKTMTLPSTRSLIIGQLLNVKCPGGPHCAECSTRMAGSLSKTGKALMPKNTAQRGQAHENLAL